MSDILKLIKYFILGLFVFTLYRFCDYKISSNQKTNNVLIVEEKIDFSLMSFVFNENNDYKITKTKIIINKNLPIEEKREVIKKAYCDYYSRLNDDLLKNYHCHGVIFLNN